MTSIAELYALQQIDLALDGQRASLTDTESRQGESEELVEARALVEERRETLRAAEKLFKEREYEADELTRKIEPVEKKLYGGKVTSPKELEDLQQDIDSLRRRRSELDDLALQAMEALEEAERAHEEARRALQQVEESSQVEQADLGTRQGQIEQEMSTLQEERAAQAELVDSPLLKLYEQLRASRQGRGVAKVEGGACQGCRISLPMSLVQRARAGTEIVQCNNCERILYVS
ncbi:MAG: C4-type zinc ribbon domain-containing protein [Dehalococcoidia bacterium]